MATEALAAGAVTRYALQNSYRKLHQNVYVPSTLVLDARARATAAWLWSGRRATLAGYSAAAVLGSRWLPDDAPAELARVRQPLDTAIIRIDALLNVTNVGGGPGQGHRGALPGRPRHPAVAKRTRSCRRGSRIPAGNPAASAARPRRSPPSRHPDTGRRSVGAGASADRHGVAGMDGRRRLRTVARGFHLAHPEDHENDIVRLEFLASRDWTIVRVSARQLRYRRPEIIARTWDALHPAGYPAKCVEATVYGAKSQESRQEP